MIFLDKTLKVWLTEYFVEVKKFFSAKDTVKEWKDKL